jgi:valyl-tRNA synthetase
LETFKRLGLSCNSWDINYNVGGRYDTDDSEFRKLTQETFIHLWNKGLIYEGIKTSNYCPVCQTVISDAEVEYEEVYTDLNYIKFKVDNKYDEVIIATTRP